MTMMQSISPQSELLANGPDSCMKFIDDYFPSKYDWFSLAERAATKAASHITLGELPLEMGLDWVRVAVTLYEAMADHPTIDNAASRLRLILPSIGLRALAIRNWGDRDDDSILSTKELTKRFLSTVKVSPTELREDFSFPRSADIRNALEMTRYLEPLLNTDILKAKLPEVFEYCVAARIARENIRTGIVDDE